MKVNRIQIQYYRSIVNTQKIELRQYSVIVGKNNEGKSNVLRAFVLAMNAIRSRIPSRQIGSLYRALDYDYSVDFPIQIDDLSPGKLNTVITLQFEFRQKEIGQFWEDVGTSLNGFLPISVIFNDGQVLFDIPKQGKGKKALMAKVDEVRRFIRDRIEMIYIPSIRSAGVIDDAIYYLVHDRLKTLSSDLHYFNLQAQIRTMQENHLRPVAKDVKEKVSNFLGEEVDIRFKINFEEKRLFSRRELNMYVDDGIETTLDRKGDGFQSLVALALLTSRNSTEDKSVIVAIEEPEIHLHPQAIREVRDTLIKISRGGQLLITTHSPLLINRRFPSHNILVNDNHASPLDSIASVIRLLGVSVADNLSSAELVLLVEGEDDVISVSSLLEYRSASLKSAIEKSRLKIVPAMGASKIPYHFTLLSNMAQLKIHVLLDNDSEGRSAYESLIGNQKADIKDFTFTNCNGMPESEFEDIIHKDIIRAILISEYGLTDSNARLSGGGKFAQRLTRSFQKSGKQFDDLLKQQVKLKIAESFAKDPSQIISEKDYFSEALVKSLEAKL